VNGLSFPIYQSAWIQGSTSYVRAQLKSRLRDNGCVVLDGRCSFVGRGGCTGVGGGDLEATAAGIGGDIFWR
jgi:hypothetical protein